jgi:hypothetical protein
VAHVDLLLLVFELEDDHWLADGVHALGHDFLDAAVDLGGKHDSVLVEEVVLKHGAHVVTTGHEVAHLVLGVGGVLPLLDLVQGGHVHTSGHEHGARVVSDGLQGSLNTVKNSLQDT